MKKLASLSMRLYKPATWEKLGRANRLLPLIFLISCGDRAIKEGVVYDSAIANIAYQTPSFSAFTTDQGVFKYRPHEKVSFSLGAIQLGSVRADNRLTVLDLTESQFATDAAATNMARLLQSLDTDLDASNGIQIADNLHALAVSPIDFFQEVLTFEQDSAVIALMQAIGKEGLPISALDAQQHLQNTLGGLGFNQAPVVNLTADQQVNSGEAVTLSATVSDRDGSLVDVGWQQVLIENDPVVTLTTSGEDELSVGGLSVKFDAPDVIESTRLLFEFSATDDQGAVTTKQTQVTVLPSM